MLVTVTFVYITICSSYVWREVTHTYEHTWYASAFKNEAFCECSKWGYLWMKNFGGFLRDYFGIGIVPKNMESKEVWQTNWEKLYLKQVSDLGHPVCSGLGWGRWKVGGAGAGTGIGM